MFTVSSKVTVVLQGQYIAMSDQHNGLCRFIRASLMAYHLQKRVSTRYYSIWSSLAQSDILHTCWPVGTVGMTSSLSSSSSSSAAAAAVTVDADYYRSGNRQYCIYSAGDFEVFSPCRGDTIHGLVWNLARWRPQVPSHRAKFCANPW